MITSQLEAQISESNSWQSLSQQNSLALTPAEISFWTLNKQALDSQMLTSFPSAYISPFSSFYCVWRVWIFFVIIFWSFPAFFPFPQTHPHNPSFVLFLALIAFPFLKRFFFLPFLLRLRHISISSMYTSSAMCFPLRPFASHYFRFYLIRKALHELRERYGRNSIFRKASIETFRHPAQWLLFT